MYEEDTQESPFKYTNYSFLGEGDASVPVQRNGLTNSLDLKGELQLPVRTERLQRLSQTAAVRLLLLHLSPPLQNTSTISIKATGNKLFVKACAVPALLPFIIMSPLQNRQPFQSTACIQDEAKHTQFSCKTQ